MKTTIKLLTLALVLFATACNNDDEMDMLNSLWRNVTQNEARIDALEKWCAQANTNITSLQTIIEAMENNETINSMTPIIQEGDTVGYVIDFGTNGPITIYDDSHPANAPQIGAKEENGVYYWTINGEWLLDENGNKLPVSGKDGANGENGQNGSNGQNGVTPQLKIENDYWWISYDNGNTWTQLGKAKGEDGESGQNGAKGDKGDAGDSMFQSVTQDADNVYFTLANGTVITIDKSSNEECFLFTITYMPNGGTGTMVVDTVRYGCSYTFKENAFGYASHVFVSWNTSADGKGAAYAPAESVVVIRNITLYAQWEDKVTTGVENGYEWVDLGLPSGLKWATCNVGASTPEGYGNYYAWGETSPKSTYSSSTFSNSPPTTLPLNRDAAAVNMGGSWRMPTYDELNELKTKCTWTWTTLNGINGHNVEGPNGNSIFLPAAGYRGGSSLYYAGSSGSYWSSSLSTDDSKYAYILDFNSSVHWNSSGHWCGHPVRGVCP